MNPTPFSSAEPWNRHVKDIGELLSALSCTTPSGKSFLPDAGFAEWKKVAEACRTARRAIYLIGNGASASMASHFAADLAKNAHLHTEVFSDLSLVTAIANDMGYEHVFSEPLSRRAQPGDMLIAISSSGRSPNVLAAVEVARVQGVTVVTLSGMDPENPLRAAGDLNFYVPAKSYGYAETCHSSILHHWMDMFTG
jgi:D-sedoheptulose 7-phosphate isomerase